MKQLRHFCFELSFGQKISLTRRDFYRIIVANERQIDEIKKEFGDDYNIEFIIQSIEEETVEDDERFKTDMLQTPKDILKEYCNHMNVQEDMLAKGLTYLAESPVLPDGQ